MYRIGVHVEVLHKDTAGTQCIIQIQISFVVRCPTLLPIYAGQQNLNFYYAGQSGKNV